jgi:hypothetical protein
LDPLEQDRLQLHERAVSRREIKIVGAANVQPSDLFPDLDQSSFVARRFHPLSIGTAGTIGTDAYALATLGNHWGIR